MLVKQLDYFKYGKFIFQRLRWLTFMHSFLGHLIEALGALSNKSKGSPNMIPLATIRKDAQKARLNF